MIDPFTPPDPSELFAKSSEQFSKFWTEFSQNVAGLQDSPAPTPDSARKMRDVFLKSLSQAYDDYLRSPEFTGQLSQMLQQGVRFQRQLSETVGRAHNAAQMPSRHDIDALMEVMQRLERRIGDGFERLEERVAALESTSNGAGVRRRPATGPKGSAKRKDTTKRNTAAKSASAKRKAAPAKGKAKASPVKRVVVTAKIKRPAAKRSAKTATKKAARKPATKAARKGTAKRTAASKRKSKN